MFSQMKKDYLLRAEWILTALLIAAAVGLHVIFLIHAGGLWRDEVNLVNLATAPSISSLTNDSFPVLMPLLVRIWTATGGGDTDLGLRVLGMCIGVSWLGTMVWTAWQLRRSPPLLGLVLVGLNCTVIVYGDSLRAYGLGSLLIVFTAGATWMLIQKPTYLRLALASTAMILSVQTLFPNAIFVAALGGGAWAVCWRHRDWRTAGKVLLAGMLAALSLLPYLGKIVAVAGVGSGLRSGFQPDIIMFNLATTAGFPTAMYLKIWEGFILVAIVAALISLGRARLKPIAADNLGIDLSLFAGVALVLGLPSFGIFLWWAELPTQTWYFLPVLAFVAMCLDAGLPTLHRTVRAGLFGFAVLTAFMGILLSEQTVRFRMTNVDLLACRLTAEAGPQDYVIVTPWMCGITFDRYFQSPPAWTTLPPLADHKLHRYDLIHVQIQNTNAIDPVLERIETTLRAGHRVWVVGWMDIPKLEDPLPGTLPPAPRPYTGWSEMPYARNWASKVAYLLRHHCRQFEVVDTPPPWRINSNENVQLLTASGWESRVSPATSPAQPQ